jgi:uncharacterized RDD family membrane protein YckC
MDRRVSQQPASLGKRVAAFGLDYLLISAYLFLLVCVGLLLQVAAPEFSRALFGSAISGELTGFAVLTLPVTLYFALGEASGASATWGKRRLGLGVLTDDGQRLSLGRSLLRSGLKFLPWELAHALIWQFRFAGPHPPLLLAAALAVVWLLVGLNLLSVLIDERHRAPYDLVARTAVISAGR